MSGYTFVVLTLTLVILLYNSTYAQEPIHLNAGNYPAKTRIGVEVPVTTLASWSSRQLERGIQITLNRKNGHTIPPVAVQQFLDKKIAKRVHSASTMRTPTKTTVTFTFNCACKATAFSYQNKKILIDIRNIDTRQNVSHTYDTIETADAVNTPSSLSAQVVTPDGQPQRTLQQIRAEIQKKLVAQAEETTSVASASIPVEKTKATMHAPLPSVKADIPVEGILGSQDQDSASVNRETSIPDIQARMMAQLEKAAQQGIIKLKGDEKDTPPSEPVDTSVENSPPVQMAARKKEEENDSGKILVGQKEHDQATRLATAEEERKKMKPVFNNGVSIADISDIDTGNIETGPQETLAPEEYPEHLQANAPRPKRSNQQLSPAELLENNRNRIVASCMPNEKFDIASWNQGINFLDGLRLVRTDLVNSRDKPDAAAVAVAMQHYIANGLSHEARYLPTAFMVETPHIAHLVEMTLILDDKPSAIQTTIARAPECVDSHALWHAMAWWNTDPAGALAAFQRGQNAMADLSRPLRVDILLRMAQAALSLDDTAQATTYLSLANRIAGKPSVKAQMLQAHIDIAQGNIVSGRNLLKELSHTRGSTGAQATLDLAKLENPVTKSTLGQLADVALLYRGKKLGITALELRAKGLAAHDNLSQAIEEIAHEGALSDIVQTQVLDIQRDMLNTALQVTQDLPSPQTLETVLSHLWLIPADAQGDTTKVNFAQYLNEQGLSGIADKMLDRSLVARHDEARWLKAAIALKNRNIDRVLDILGDNKSAQDNLLRLQAVQLQQDNDALLIPLQSTSTATTATVAPPPVVVVPPALQTSIKSQKSDTDVPQLKNSTALSNDAARDIELLREMLNDG